MNAAPHAQASFYRTSNGAEVDPVLELRSGQTWVIEIKRSTAPTVSKGFYLATADLRATRKLLVAPRGAALPDERGNRGDEPARGSALGGRTNLKIGVWPRFSLIDAKRESPCIDLQLPD